MIKYFLLLFILIILFIPFSCKNKERIDNKLDLTKNEISVCQWENGCKTCINISFDDVSVTHLIIAKILTEYGWKGSFFIIPNHVNYLWRQRLPPYREIVKMGHEIGNHTYSHPDMTLLDSTEIIKQISTCNKWIQDSLEVHCLSFAFPYGRSNNISQKLAFKLNQFVRDISEYNNVKRDYIAFGPSTTQEFIENQIKESITSGHMLLLIGHTIESNGETPGSEYYFRKLFDKMKEYELKNEIWITTFNEGAQYEALYNEIHLEKSIINDTIILNISGFNKNKYKYLSSSPISIKLNKNYYSQYNYLSKEIDVIHHTEYDIITINLKKLEKIKIIPKIKTEDISVLFKMSDKHG